MLINSTGSAVKAIVSSLGETYTHEMISQGPGSASQSEYKGPASVSSCNYPLDINSLEFGFPGMEKSLNVGGIYADIYGSGTVAFAQSGSQNVTWQLGDSMRANAIADALDAAPSVDVQVTTGQYIHQVLRNGATSPYGLHQFFDIETTELGAGGQSINNTSISSTFCAYAYALGGPPMTSYDYSHSDTSNAAIAFRNYTTNQCEAGLPWYLKDFPFSVIGGLFGCDPATICVNAAAMVMNCTVLGGSYCGSNGNDWFNALSSSTSHARTISPDRLGGLTRFLTDVPRPTTWATDSQHPLTWSGGGRVCGCFE